MERLYITSPEVVLEFNEEVVRYKGKSYPVHQLRLMDTADPIGAHTGAESGKKYALTHPVVGIICRIPVNSYNFVSFSKLQAIVRSV